MCSFFHEFNQKQSKSIATFYDDDNGGGGDNDNDNDVHSPVKWNQLN